MTRFLENFKKLYKALPIFGPIPFSLKKDFRYVYSRIYYCKTSRYNRFFRWILFSPTLLLWYFKATACIVRDINLYAHNVKVTNGIGILKQIKSLLYLVFIKNASPDIYYYLKLFENKIRIGEEYLTDNHFSPILSYLIWNKNWEILTNKYDFWQKLKPHISHIINILGVASMGELKLLSGVDQLPETDLFLKPIDGHGGNNCSIIRYKGNSQFEIGSTGILYNNKNLIELLKYRSKNQIFILQPFQYNHPDLVPLSNGSLSTCRITSYVDQAGDIQFLFALFMMPIDDSATSNTNGICSAVDMETGTLSAAIRIDNPFKNIEIHPQGRGKIAQTTLPYWSEAKDLCRQAHRIFPDLPIVGWDIAFTPQGALLVEGNLIWPVEYWALTHLNNCDYTKFIKLLEWNLRKAEV